MFNASGIPTTHPHLTEVAAHMLNDEIIRSRLPGTKQQKFHDTKGLYLLVMPTGAKLWRFKYRFPPRVRDNKRTAFHLGAIPKSH